MQATLRIIVNNVVVNDKKLTIPWIHYLTSCHNQTFHEIKYLLISKWIKNEETPIK